MDCPTCRNQLERLRLYEPDHIWWRCKVCNWDLRVAESDLTDWDSMPVDYYKYNPQLYPGIKELEPEPTQQETIVLQLQYIAETQQEILARLADIVEHAASVLSRDKDVSSESKENAQPA